MNIEKHLSEDQIKYITNQVKYEIEDLISYELSANGYSKAKRDRLIIDEKLVNDILKLIHFRKKKLAKRLTRVQKMLIFK